MLNGEPMNSVHTSAFQAITEEIRKAIDAPKCHRCGCLHKTVEALAETDFGQRDLLPILTEARSVFKPKEYDCLGCPVCFPAIAANAFAEMSPELSAGLNLCPTEEPERRTGWPPLPGDYHVVRYQAPVAVCVLNTASLATTLNERAPAGLSIVGTMHTENLGIERLIQNTVANPNVRFLILCGEDTQQSIGHLPGQSLHSLFENGIDGRGKIIGARGKRPYLKNLPAGHLKTFLAQIEIVPMIGEENPDAICDRVERLQERNPGAFAAAPMEIGVQTVHAPEPSRLTLDKAGYLVVYPEPRRMLLIVEHYTNPGILDCVIEGTSPAALYTEVIARNLISRLDHAAYLGRELARAEHSLASGDPFLQDRAPGEIDVEPGPRTGSCGCSNSSNTGTCS